MFQLPQMFNRLQISARESTSEQSVLFGAILRCLQLCVLDRYYSLQILLYPAQILDTLCKLQQNRPRTELRRSLEVLCSFLCFVLGSRNIHLVILVAKKLQV